MRIPCDLDSSYCESCCLKNKDKKCYVNTAYLQAIEDTLDWLHDGCFDARFDSLFKVCGGDAFAVLDIIDKHKVAEIIYKNMQENK